MSDFEKDQIMQNRDLRILAENSALVNYQEFLTEKLPIEVEKSKTMSKLQVKIDGEWQDFCEVVDKPLLYLEQEEISKTKILTDIRDYLMAILDEWQKRIDEPNFYEQNIGVYNHIRKELDDLTEYAEKLGVEL